MISSAQAAKAIGLPEITIRRYAAASVIPAIKIGRHWKFESVEMVRRGLSLNKGNKLQREMERGRA